MKSVVVIGAGKIGSTIAGLLSRSGDYSVMVADRSAAQLAAIEPHAGGRARSWLDIADRERAAAACSPAISRC